MPSFATVEIITDPAPIKESMEALISILFVLAGIYLLLGMAFALPFLWRGANFIDPSARGAGWGFRLIILPGTVALWPLLTYRWLSGHRDAPTECNAHRALTEEKSP